MATQIVFTPRGESTAVTLDLTGIFGGITLFRGGMQSDRVTGYSVGGKALSVTHDAWWDFDIEARSLNRGASATSFAAVSSLVSHLNAGGQFAFYMDSGNSLNTTMSSNHTQGDTGIGVNSTATLAAGDIVYLESASDPTKWELNSVASVGASTVTLNRGVDFSYPSASVFRHYEFFPTCIGMSPPTFTERPGGQGALIYDLRFDFRSVR